MGPAVCPDSRFRGNVACKDWAERARLLRRHHRRRRRPTGRDQRTRGRGFRDEGRGGLQAALKNPRSLPATTARSATTDTTPTGASATGWRLLQRPNQPSECASFASSIAPLAPGLTIQWQGVVVTGSREGKVVCMNTAVSPSAADSCSEKSKYAPICLAP